MIHVDRNHHSATQNLIGDHKIIWSDIQDSFLSPIDPLSSDLLHPKLGSTTTTAITTQDATDTRSDRVTPPSGPAHHTPSSVRDRSSSLSPAPGTGSVAPSPIPATEVAEDPVLNPQPGEDEQAEDEPPASVSRLSPLSELSPPPDLDDEREVRTADGTRRAEIHVKVESSPPTLPSSMSTDHPTSPTTTQGIQLQQNEAHPSEILASDPMSLSHSVPSPTAGPLLSNHSPNNRKVTAMLELNTELLNVCMEFQHRGFTISSDSRIQQYAQRLQSNLQWMATAVDQKTGMSVPIVDPPPPVDFYSMDRLQQLYSELSSLFAKDIARRQQQTNFTSMSNAPLPMQSSGPHNSMNPPPFPTTLKRDREEEVTMSTKRRNTGELKPSPVSSMLPFSVPMSRNDTAPPLSINPSMNHSNIPPPHFSPITNGGHSTLFPNPTQIPHSAPKSVPTQDIGPMTHSTSPTSHTHHLPLTSPPSQPPIPSPQLSDARLAAVIGNPAEAQLAASHRERARQAQIRQAQLRAAATANVQMSPPPLNAGGGGMGMGPSLGGSVGLNMSARPGSADGGISMGIGISGAQSQPQHGMHQGQHGMMGGAAFGGGVNMNGMNPSLSNTGTGNSSHISTAGPGHGGGVLNPQLQQQLINILQTPTHPFMQYMNRNVPGFAGMSVQQQMQRMLYAQNVLRQQQQQPQQDHQPQQQSSQLFPRSHMQHPQQQHQLPSHHLAQGVPSSSTQFKQHSSIPGGGDSFPGMNANVNTNSTSPVLSHQQQHNTAFGGLETQGHSGASTGMDPRLVQRQQMLLMQQQQQARLGQGQGQGQGQYMMMQQQQQERIREQQRMGMGIGNGMGMGMGSGMGVGLSAGGGGLGSGSAGAIPGIARSARSPPEAAPGANSGGNPMITRGGGGPPRPNTGMSRDDYARMMHAQRALAAQSPPHGQGQMPGSHIQQQQQPQAGTPWQQPDQGQHHSHMHGGGGSYGMSPPGSTYGSAPSPLGSVGGGGSGWQAQSSYPFTSPSPGAEMGMRHMSATPCPPQHQQQQHQNPNSVADMSMPGEFDLFNWPQ